MSPASPDYGGRKIFVASTTTDLVDVREELHTYLQDLGLMPVMCEHTFRDDRKKSGRVRYRCDLNVREADAVVVIVSERYGERSVNSELSYTHEEYLQARRWGKPVYFYARRFLWNEYQRWVNRVSGTIQKDLREAQKRWVNGPGAKRRSLGAERPAGILRVLARVPDVKRAIRTPAGHAIEGPELRGLYFLMLNQQCWPAGDKGHITAFDTVVDLKEHLRHDLNANRLVANYEDLLRAGKLPFIRVAGDNPQGEYSASQDIYLRLANVAPTPAAFDSMSGLYVTLNRADSLYLARESHEIGTKRDDRPLTKVPDIDWSPAAPAVWRDGEEHVVRIALPAPGRKTRPIRRFWVWLVYQSVLGESFYTADRYVVTVPGPRGGMLRVVYEGKHVLLPESVPGRKKK